MAVLQQFLAWRKGRIEEESDAEEDMPVLRRRRRGRRVVEDSNSEDEQGEERSFEASETRVDEEQWRTVIRKLREWDGVCLVCKAVSGSDERRHSFAACASDRFVVGMVQAVVEQVGQMAAPRSEQGRCWVPWVGKKKERVQEWVKGDRVFDEEIEAGMDGVEALGIFFRQQKKWEGGVDGNMMGELIVRFA
ncbi:hypothetical protein B0A55_11427 [Friedmanniomyces simplex]|uniref:Uncharacterized protein n=1 Tax=Friedmanniomyces simplex TaxID=329884 RepID=A0A4U0WLF5_9PEZI|nr:hypothetical protein B0A55_10995 [Friedmanniomyces simplex]TKA63303.1 hypothetical protein B0A55_11427 [Friedmanniomyces simplex]